MRACTRASCEPVRVLAEKPVHEGHGHRAFADCRRDALDRPGPDVARRERARHAGLEIVGTAFERPPPFERRTVVQIGAGDEIAAGIADDGGVLRPFGIRRAADADEQARGRHAFGWAVVRADSDRIEPAVAVQCVDRRPVAHRDVRRALDPVDQIARQRVGERCAAHEHRDLARMAREIHRGLAGRIAAADDEHVFTGAHRRLARSGAVKQPGVEKRGLLRQPEAAVFDAGRADVRAGDEHRAIGEIDVNLAVDEARVHAFAHRQQFDAELHGLFSRALREFRARNAVREAHVVLDQRAGAGLTAHRSALDQHRAQPFRCRIDGRRQTGRPRAVDRHVVFDEARLRDPAEPRGDFRERRLVQARAVRKDHDRQPDVAQRCDAELARAVGVGGELAPVVRDHATLQEIADRIRVAAARHADDSYVVRLIHARLPMLAMGTRPAGGMIAAAVANVRRGGAARGGVHNN
ncbi:hypothetical protein BVI2075_530049 [Burkholderia vietnamiensis]|nr:hypothetical protein BVI2075_530049 [Burkholderia vietnamiensis]